MKDNKHFVKTYINIELKTIEQALVTIAKFNALLPEGLPAKKIISESKLLEMHTYIVKLSTNFKNS